MGFQIPLFLLLFYLLFYIYSCYQDIARDPARIKLHFHSFGKMDELSTNSTVSPITTKEVVTEQAIVEDTSMQQSFKKFSIIIVTHNEKLLEKT